MCRPGPRPSTITGSGSGAPARIGNVMTVGSEILDSVVNSGMPTNTTSAATARADPTSTPSKRIIVLSSQHVLYCYRAPADVRRMALGKRRELLEPAVQCVVFQAPPQ